MKISSVILLVTLMLIVTAMFASNVLLKKEYNKVDKSDLYWTYGTILQQPFRHLKIEGGNVTNIAFEQSKKASVRISKNWIGYEQGLVKAMVRNDTLFVNVPNAYKDQYEKQWLKRITPVRIFAPELLSVDGFNTNLELFKLKQKSIAINVSGKSKLEVESYLYDFDTLRISQKDSSVVVFEMSPDLMNVDLAVAAQTKAVQSISGEGFDASNGAIVPPIRKGWETMRVQYAEANLQNLTLLDLGHAQIKSFKYTIADSAGIILSGGTLKKLQK